jgi:hypothetical protein
MEDNSEEDIMVEPEVPENGSDPEENAEENGSAENGEEAPANEPANE